MPSASAASEDTGRRPTPPATASARAVASPILKPVKVPGPTPTAIAPTSPQSSPECSITSATAGISSDAWAGRPPRRSTDGATSKASPSSRSRHALEAAVEVSNPRMFTRP